MESQSSSNLFVSVVTITIITFGFASIACVSSAPHNVYVINGLNGADTLGVNCGESEPSGSYKPPDQPQFTLQHGERHQFHLDKLPAKYFACQFVWSGQESRFYVITSANQEDRPDWYYLAKSDKIYTAAKDLPLNDPAWVDSNFKWQPKGWYQRQFR